jgi:disulfide bond formation protein DsbB
VERTFDFFCKLGERWQSWAALIAICVALEAGALYFQEARLQYPCELCIYTRVWLAAIALVALAGLALRNTRWPMRALLATELGLSVGLASVVWELLGLEYGFGGAGACSMFANFPSWAPLDEWLPMLFRIQGPCAATPEVVLGLSMADGLAVTTVGFLAAFTLALCGSFVRQRRSYTSR